MLNSSCEIDGADLIAHPPEAVWDYTQNYAYRCNWDPALEKADERQVMG